MTMKERIARAIHEEIELRDDLCHYEYKYKRESMILVAEAVLDAMREPTEAMIEVGIEDHGWGDCEMSEMHFRWQAMIDAAKSETPNLSTDKPAWDKT